MGNPAGNSGQASGFAAIIATGACAAMIFNTLPLFLGVAADTYDLGSEGSGWLGTIYLAGFGLSSVAAAFLITRTSRRSLSLVLFLSAALLLALAAGAGSRWLFVTLLFAVGLSFGAQYSLSFVIAGERSNPTRAFGVKLLGEVLLGAALLAVIPLFLLPRFGLAGMLIAFAATAAAGALCVPWIAGNGSAREVTQTPVRGSSLPVPAVIGLAALFAFTIGQSALWSFTERRASLEGFEADAIGLTLSAAALSGGLGSLAAAWLSDRRGRLAPLAGAALLYGMAILLFAVGGTLWAFGAAVSLFMFAWLFALPYMTFSISASDVGGRATSLVAACLAFGSMVGPGMAGQLVAGGSFGPLYLFAAIVTFAAYASFWRLASARGVSR